MGCGARAAVSNRRMPGTEACARFVCILLIAASPPRPDRPRGSMSPRARTGTRSGDRDSLTSCCASGPLMTAVQKFKGLAELRTTSVECDALCVRGRRHDMTHDAFDDIPPRTTFTVSFPAVCSNSACGPSAKLVVSPVSMILGAWRCPEESNVLACVATAYYSHTIAVDP